MEKPFSEITKEEIEKRMQGNYGFDPSAIITIISEHPEIGLALVQLPISIANSLIYKYNEMKWSDHPTSPGYYWVNFNGSIAIKEYASREIDAIISLGNPRQYKYAGPLEPPK